MRFCPYCGVKIAPGGLVDPSAETDESRVLRFDRLYDPDRIQPAKMSAFVAGALSLLVPGLGHVFIGQWRKGCEVFAGFAFAAVLLAATATGGVLLSLGNKDVLAFLFRLAVIVGGFLLLVVYGVAAVDAAMLARKLGHTAVGKQEWWFTQKKALPRE